MRADLLEGNGECPGDSEALSVAQLAGEAGQVADGQVVLLVGGQRRLGQEAQRREYQHPRAAPHAVAFTTTRSPWGHKRKFIELLILGFSNSKESSESAVFILRK